MSRDWTEFGRGTPPKVLRYNRVDHEELIVEPPLADSLSHGRVVIQYRTENLHIAPVFRPGALAVSPRVGHLHVSVDDLPCHWVDASGEPLTVVGLPAGPHKIRINLANANHTVLETQTVKFVIQAGSARLRQVATGIPAAQIHQLSRAGQEPAPTCSAPEFSRNIRTPQGTAVSL
jgi:hypothetical protein